LRQSADLRLLQVHVVMIRKHSSDQRRLARLTRPNKRHHGIIPRRLPQHWTERAFDHRALICQFMYFSSRTLFYHKYCPKLCRPEFCCTVEAIIGRLPAKRSGTGQRKFGRHINVSSLFIRNTTGLSGSATCREGNREPKYMSDQSPLACCMRKMTGFSLSASYR